MAYKRKYKDDLTAREIGRMGGRRNAETHDKEWFRDLGRKGGTVNSAKHDHDHFVECGRKGGRRMSELVRKAKEAEASGA